MDDLRGTDHEREVIFRRKVGDRERERGKKMMMVTMMMVVMMRKSVWYITVAALPDLLGAHFSVAELTEPTQLRCGACQLTRGGNREQFGRENTEPRTPSVIRQSNRW